MKIAENVVLIVGIVFGVIVVKTISEEARLRALKNKLYEECCKVL